MYLSLQQEGEGVFPKHERYSRKDGSLHRKIERQKHAERPRNRGIGVKCRLTAKFLTQKLLMMQDMRRREMAVAARPARTMEPDLFLPVQYFPLAQFFWFRRRVKDGFEDLPPISEFFYTRCPLP